MFILELGVVSCPREIRPLPSVFLRGRVEFWIWRGGVCYFSLPSGVTSAIFRSVVRLAGSGLRRFRYFFWDNVFSGGGVVAVLVKFLY